jgi:O-antigen biosynthesis protein
MKISIIVTNWNGLKLLQKNFQRVIDTSQEAEEIIFTDDASGDESVSYMKSLQKKYPKIKIIAHKKNVGFGKNSNYAVSKAKGDLVVLLNNDIYPHDNYIKNSLKHFKDKNVFGVGFAESGNENWGNIYWQNGYLQHNCGYKNKKTHITAWLSGGSSIIRRDLFLELGGFDNVYEPFYYEDLDLGFRAWKSGYKLLWDPHCIVDHKHESTISKFPKKFLDYVKERNRLLIILRNIDNKKLLKQNKYARFLRVLSGPNYIKIIRAAKKQIRQNPPPIHKNKLTDIEVLNLFKQ